MPAIEFAMDQSRDERRQARKEETRRRLSFSEDDPVQYADTQRDTTRQDEESAPRPDAAPKAAQYDRQAGEAAREEAEAAPASAEEEVEATRAALLERCWPTPYPMIRFQPLNDEFMWELTTTEQGLGVLEDLSIKYEGIEKWRDENLPAATYLATVAKARASAGAPLNEEWLWQLTTSEQGLGVLADRSIKYDEIKNGETKIRWAQQ